MAGLSGVVLTQNIGCTQCVSVRRETTSRAAELPPLGFRTVQIGRAIRQRAWTRLTPIGFADQGDRDASSVNLVGEIPALPAMRPDADLLLGLRVQALAIGHVAHIPNN